METAKGLRPDNFYHGTSIALAIQAYGLDVSQAGTNAGALLGPGVYCTTTWGAAWPGRLLHDRGKGHGLCERGPRGRHHL